MEVSGNCESTQINAISDNCRDSIEPMIDGCKKEQLSEKDKCNITFNEINKNCVGDQVDNHEIKDIESDQNHENLMEIVENHQIECRDAEPSDETTTEIVDDHEIKEKEGDYNKNLEPHENKVTSILKEDKSVLASHESEDNVGPNCSKDMGSTISQVNPLDNDGKQSKALVESSCHSATTDTVVVKDDEKLNDLTKVTSLLKDGESDLASQGSQDNVKENCSEDIESTNPQVHPLDDDGKQSRSLVELSCHSATTDTVEVKDDEKLNDSTKDTSIPLHINNINISEDDKSVTYDDNLESVLNLTKCDDDNLSKAPTNSSVHEENTDSSDSQCGQNKLKRSSTTVDDDIVYGSIKKKSKPSSPKESTDVNMVNLENDVECLDPLAICNTGETISSSSEQTVFNTVPNPKGSTSPNKVTDGFIADLGDDVESIDPMAFCSTSFATGEVNFESLATSPIERTVFNSERNQRRGNVSRRGRPNLKNSRRSIPHENHGNLNENSFLNFESTDSALDLPCVDSLDTNLSKDANLLHSNSTSEVKIVEGASLNEERTEVWREELEDDVKHINPISNLRFVSPKRKPATKEKTEPLEGLDMTVVVGKIRKVLRKNVSSVFTEDTREKCKIALLQGWVREIVYRATVAENKNLCDVYYRLPGVKKLRSMHDIERFLSTHSTSLTTENFSFYKEPFGFEEQFEIVRHASTGSNWMKNKQKSENPGTLQKLKNQRPPKKKLDAESAIRHEMETKDSASAPSNPDKRLRKPSSKLFDGDYVTNFENFTQIIKESLCLRKPPVKKPFYLKSYTNRLIPIKSYGSRNRKSDVNQAAEQYCALKNSLSSSGDESPHDQFNSGFQIDLEELECEDVDSGAFINAEKDLVTFCSKSEKCIPKLPLVQIQVKDHTLFNKKIEEPKKMSEDMPRLKIKSMSDLCYQSPEKKIIYKEEVRKKKVSFPGSDKPIKNSSFNMAETHDLSSQDKDARRSNKCVTFFRKHNLKVYRHVPISIQRPSTLIPTVVSTEIKIAVKKNSNLKSLNCPNQVSQLEKLPSLLEPLPMKGISENFLPAHNAQVRKTIITVNKTPEKVSENNQITRSTPEIIDVKDEIKSDDDNDNITISEDKINHQNQPRENTGKFISAEYHIGGVDGSRLKLCDDDPLKEQNLDIIKDSKIVHVGLYLKHEDESYSEKCTALVELESNVEGQVIGLKKRNKTKLLKASGHIRFEAMQSDNTCRARLTDFKIHDIHFKHWKLTS